MKKVKFLLSIAIFFITPFLSKAQIIGGLGLNLTIQYNDVGHYGALSCNATNNYTTYFSTIPSNTTYTFTATVPAGILNHWNNLSFSALGNNESIAISTIEAQTISVAYYYHPVSTGTGTAYAYSVTRIGVLNYQIITYVIPL